MKRTFILFLSVLLYSLGFGQIWVLDFETTGGYTTSTSEFSDGADDYFTNTLNNAIGETYSGYQGSYYFAAQDLDGEGGDPIDTIWIGPIDISAYKGKELYFSMLVGQLFSGWDASDYVHFEYSFDDTNYVPFIWFENDGSTYNSHAYLDTNYDGVGDTLTFKLTDPMKLLVDSFYNDTASNVYFRIVLALNAGSEDIAFDSLALSDQKPVIKRNITEAYYMLGDTLFITYDEPPSADALVASNFALKTNNTSVTFNVLESYGRFLKLYDPQSEIIGDGIIDTLIDVYDQDTALLYAGIIPIKYFNEAYSTKILNGYNVVVSGIVTGNANYKNVFIADSSGKYHGLNIYDGSATLKDLVAVGDSIIVWGKRTVYNYETELVYDSLLYKGSPTSLVINPVVIPASVIDTNLAADDPTAEPYENVLVTVDSLTVIQDTDVNYVYRAAYDTYGVWIDDILDYQYADGLTLTVGHSYNITGIVIYSSGWKLNPRGITDVYDLATQIKPVADEAVIYPNPAVDVLNVVGIKNLKIYDNLGRLIKSKDFSQNSQINISDLPSGMYILKYETFDGKSGAKKLIKR